MSDPSGSPRPVAPEPDATKVDPLLGLSSDTAIDPVAPIEGADHAATEQATANQAAAALVADLVDEVQAEAEAGAAFVFGAHRPMDSRPETEPDDADVQARLTAEADAAMVNLDLMAPPGDAEAGLLRSEFNHARDFISRLTPRQLRDGSWFHALLERTAAKLVKRQRNRIAIGVWRARFPDLDEAALSRRIIASGARRTAMVGGMAGAAMTAVELGVIGSLGLAVPAAIVLALAELAVLERIQLSMVFTLAAQYDVPMGHEKLHEIGALYAHVLRIKGASRAAAWSRTGTLALTRVIGLRFARQAAVKMALPVVSMGLGAGMNYLMTRTLGRHTLRKFRQSDHTRSHLVRVIDRDPEARRLLFCLMVRMAVVDGRVDRRERDLLRRTLDELAPGPEEHAALEADMHLPESVLLDRLHTYTDPDFYDLVLETLSLMAVADGIVAPAEEALLRRVSDALQRPYDPAALQARFDDFVRAPSRFRLPFGRARRTASEASRSTPV